jgi:hypothetical protein
VSGAIDPARAGDVVKAIVDEAGTSKCAVRADGAT